jgi:hypothetical protein
MLFESTFFPQYRLRVGNEYKRTHIGRIELFQAAAHASMGTLWNSMKGYHHGQSAPPFFFFTSDVML